MTGGWVPAELRRGPLPVSDLRGLPTHRLRSPHLARPTRGVRSLSLPAAPEGWIDAVAPVLPPGSAVSHTSACREWGLPLPEGLEADPAVHVMSEGSTRVRRVGCVGHRGLASREVGQVGGLRVVGMADTWCDMGELLGRGMELDDLVVLGDAIVWRLDRQPGPHRDLPVLDQRLRANSPGLALLAATLARRVRPRGGRALREALALVVPGVRSPMETRARLMFVRAGFPEPLANLPIFRPDGSWLLEGDLVWREQKVVGEYQGKDHADISRRSRDSDRAVDAEESAWCVMEIFAADVLRAPRRRRTLRRFADKLGLDPRELRIE